MITDSMGENTDTHYCDSPLFTEVDVNGLSSQTDAKLRTLLYQCISCRMYRPPVNAKSELHNQFMKGFPLNSMFLCKKCSIVSEQEKTINNLHHQLEELSTTVQKLRDIRCIETEIDMSIHNLVSHRRSPHHDNSVMSSELCDTVEPSPDSLHFADQPPFENNIQPHMSPSIDNVIESMAQQFSELRVSNVETLVDSRIEEADNLSATGDVSGLTEDTIVSISSGSDITSTSMTGISTQQVEISKFQPNNFVKLCLLGTP